MIYESSVILIQKMGMKYVEEPFNMGMFYQLQG